MALQSPGVEVTVIDESFYTPAEPGTTPLIVVATAENKDNAAGTGTAAATSAANAGRAFKITSQKELVDLFGVPFFEKTASNTPIHGSELNEYGLLAAYSLLGVSNSAFVVRADVDLGQLVPQAEAPGSVPTDGTWWVNTRSTTWGIQEWNGAAISVVGGQKFTNKIPLVLTDTDTQVKTTGAGGAPKESVGSIGDYAIVFQTTTGTGSFSAGAETARLYYKTAGNSQFGVTPGSWVLVGSNEWSASFPVVQGENYVPPTGAISFTINSTTINVDSGSSISNTVTLINGSALDGVAALEVNNRIYLYNNGTGNNNTIVIGGDSPSSVGLTDGTFNGVALQQTPHTDVPAWKTADQDRPSGSVWIKTTEPNFGARWRASKYNSGSLSWEPYEAPIYSSTHSSLFFLDRSGGGENIPVDQLMVQSNAEEHTGTDASPPTVTFKVWRRASTGVTTITSSVIGTSSFTLGTNQFAIKESLKGVQTLSNEIEVNFTAAGNVSDADAMAAAINAAGFTNIEAAVTTDFRVQITHKLGGDFRLRDIQPVSGPIASIFTPFSIQTGAGTSNFYDLPAGAEDSTADPDHDQYLASNWKPLAAENYEVSPDDPINEPANGQLWYNPEFSDVDLMIHDGTTWVGYRNASSPFNSTDTTRLGYTPIVSASNPYVSGITATGDIWISTADLENFPIMYRYEAGLSGTPAAARWIQIDITDQVTEDGILFADARWANSGGSTDGPYPSSTIEELASSNYLDPDAPDPALYPKGMLLWNLRRSGGNVKIYRKDYIDTTADNQRQPGDPSMGSYFPSRWATYSANNEDGSGSFGRKAQRKVVVAAMKSVVDTSSEIRDEERRNFNLIAAPGYPELLSNLVNLNIDRGLTSFVIGDTPLRLPSDATSLVTWGTNANLVVDNGDDGIVTYDEYLATFYPNGFTTDLGGNNAVVPASHMMMRTIALSDQVSYPWFAPAGTRRGGITNATAVGYIDSLSGEFQTVALNEGQRDTLYDLKVNPIAFFNGVGLVNYGQKTRARNASALDRINVARLVVYLRSQLNKLARPYIFEPNDDITRAEIKGAVESLLLELVGLRALYDFAVVCDTSNNTPARIDRNELYVDIAIEPVKAVEFIYIPLRVKNTGEI